MFPLLFVDTEEAERRKRKKAQDSLFGQLSEDLVECLEVITSAVSSLKFVKFVGEIC